MITEERLSELETDGRSATPMHRELQKLCGAYREKLERAEIGVDGNAGFALLGENIQVGEAEFVEIALPVEASKDPNRYHHSEWCDAAERAASAALRKLKARLAPREFSYYLGTSHPRHLA